MWTSLDSFQGRSNVCNPFCTQQKSVSNAHSHSWNSCMQPRTLCFLVCVKRVGTSFAIPDRPPSNAFALGVVANTPFKQVKQGCHVRYRGPRRPCHFTAVDRADGVSFSLLWATFTNSYCPNANFCDLVVPIVDFSANAS